jgi:hypothetical protein
MNTNKVCGEYPEICYKAFDCREYAEDFMYRGIFRLNCLGYCRNMEDESRRDSTEGYGHTKEPGIVTVLWVSPNPAEKTILTKEQGCQEHHIEHGNAIFCFCTCLPEVSPDHVKDKFGKYIVKIDEPKKLAEAINDYFISKEEKKLIPNERLDMAYKQKPESFIRDCEFRIIAIKLGEPCKQECQFLRGQFEQIEPECKFIEVNLERQLDYVSFVTLQ